RLLGGRRLRRGLLDRRSLLGALDVLGVLVLGLAHFLSSWRSRSWRTVRMRAISRFASFRRALFSSAPVTDWKRRLKSSWRRSCSAFSSSSSVMSLRSLAFKEIRLPCDDFGIHGQLVAGETQRFLRELLGHAGE